MRALVATPIEGRRYKTQRMKEAEEAENQARAKAAEEARARRVEASKEAYKSGAADVPDPYSF